MGGIGSGRHWRLGASDTTDNYRSIDVRRWQREGLLDQHQPFRWQWLRNNEVVGVIQVTAEPGRVLLTYRHRSGGSDWKDECYPVYLNWTACNLGGQRPWFLCPTKDCGRRVALLYGGAYFVCRHCQNLTYPSQREERYDRLARRADKIRRKLGWEPGILNGPGWQKPKGMHWKTFSRLAAEHDELVHASLQGMAIKFRLIGESVEDWI